MAPRRDWRRVTAASATLSAGALVFFAAGASPASAETQPAAGTSGCPLGKLLCGILGQGGSGTPSSPLPTSAGGGGTASKPPAPKPQPKPKPVAKPAPAHHRSTGGAGGAPPAIPPAAGAPSYPVPQSAQWPALPDVSDQDPLVMPEAAPDEGPPPARLSADSASGDATIPPLLVATASGLIGAVAALNLSVLRRRND